MARVSVPTLELGPGGRKVRWSGSGGASKYSITPLKQEQQSRHWLHQHLHDPSVLATLWLLTLATHLTTPTRSYRDTQAWPYNQGYNKRAQPGHITGHSRKGHPGHTKTHAKTLRPGHITKATVRQSILVKSL